MEVNLASNEAEISEKKDFITIVLKKDEAKISAKKEKPKKSKSNLASAGIYLINTKYFLSKNKNLSSSRPLDLSLNFIEKFHKENFYGYVTENFLPFGNNSDYEKNVINL